MRRLIPFLIPTLALAAGCGGPKTAHVSGVITLNGEPLRNANVNFEPIATSGITAAGTTSFGKTDDNGRYTLRLIDPDREGAVVCKHRVSITLLNEEQVTPGLEDVGPPQLPGEPVPARYNLETKLTFEVPAGGTDSANFALTSP